jgi:nitrate reductase NapE component
MVRKLYIAFVNSISRNCRIILKLQNEIKTFLVIILLCFLTISVAYRGVENEKQRSENNR